MNTKEVLIEFMDYLMEKKPLMANFTQNAIANNFLEAHPEACGLVSNEIKVKVLDIYAGGYRLEYDGKYITLYGKDKRCPDLWSQERDFETTVLVPVVMEIKNSCPFIDRVENGFIYINLGL